MRYVIIGNSAAAISAIEAIRKVDKVSSITVISREEFTAYSPILTTYFISGKVTAENMIYRDLKWYEKQQVEMVSSTEIVKVDTLAKKVFASDGTDWPYDKLLIATGASPAISNIPGSQADGVFGVRTFKDALEIKESLEKAKKAVVVGGGLVSCKAAEALRKSGIEVEMVISSGQLLSRMLSSKQAAFIQEEAERNGIIVRTRDDVVSIESNGKNKTIRLVSGDTINCDIVIIGKGVVPNYYMLDKDYVKVDRGILVDEYMRTSSKDVYAAGDVVQTKNLLNGRLEVNAIWPEAVEQGAIAGFNMAGQNVKYTGSLSRNTLSFFNIKVASVGFNRSANDKQQSFFFNRGKGSYCEFIMEGSNLVGAIVVGDISAAGIYASIIKKGMVIDKVTELLNPSMLTKRILD